MRLICYSVLILSQLLLLLANSANSSGFGYELIMVTLEKIQEENKRLKDAVQATKGPADLQFCPENFTDGVYKLNPAYCTIPKFSVYCKKGWIVIEHNHNAHLDYYQSWKKFKEGFGNLGGAHWLGLEKVHQITRSGQFKMMLSYTNSKGVTQTGTYDRFAVSSELERYQVHIGAFSGDSAVDILRDGARFSTGDNVGEEANCSTRITGWWRLKCSQNPNHLAARKLKYTLDIMIRPT